MAITKAECKEIRVDKSTFGGETYYVKRKNDKEFIAVCFRPLYDKRGSKAVDENNRLLRCDRLAGHGTDHKGEGACKTHGGSNGATSGVGRYKHGRTAIKTQSKLTQRIDKYYEKDREELLDVKYELASVRAIFKELIDNLSEYHDDEFSRDIRRIMELTSIIGTLVDKISTIESRNALTISQIMYFRATVADILMKYIKDPKMQELAAKELVQRVGASKEYVRVNH